MVQSTPSLQSGCSVLIKPDISEGQNVKAFNRRIILYHRRRWAFLGRPSPITPAISTWPAHRFELDETMSPGRDLFTELSHQSGKNTAFQNLTIIGRIIASAFAQCLGQIRVSLPRRHREYSEWIIAGSSLAVRSIIPTGKDGS